MTNQPIPQPARDRGGCGGLADWWKLNTGQAAVQRGLALRAVVEEFKRDVTQGTDMSDCVTQDFFHARRLVGNSLARAQIRVTESFRPRQHDKTKLGVFFMPDGKNIAGLVEDYTLRVKAYAGATGRLAVKDPYGLDYAVITSKVTPAGEVLCPNCGGASTPEQMVAGCPYCGTPYRIEDFQDKIASAVPSYTNFNWGPRALRNCLIGFPLVFLVLGGVTLIGGRAQEIAVDLFSRIAFPPIFFLIVAFLTMLPVGIAGTARSSSIAGLRRRLQQADPYFSVKHFLGTADHRLKVWALERDPRARALVSGLPVPPDVVDIDVIEWQKAAFTPAPGGAAITLKALVRTVTAANGRPKAAKQRMTLTFQRDESVRTNYRGSIFFVPCHNCGASISLLEGAQCPYCGTGVRAAAYDWVLTQAG